MKRLSVVVPVYFNQETLVDLHARISEQEQGLAGRAKLEIVYVDDGSGDDSREILRTLAASDSRIRLVFLSRNFGSFTAILAGLHYATGDAIAIISADLQDPPEMIPIMFEKWEGGDKTVLAVRENRMDSWGARLFSKMAYVIIRRMALPTMPKGGFDFVLVDRQVRDVLLIGDVEDGSGVIGRSAPRCVDMDEDHEVHRAGALAPVPHARQAARPRRDRGAGSCHRGARGRQWRCSSRRAEHSNQEHAKCRPGHQGGNFGRCCCRGRCGPCVENGGGAGRGVTRGTGSVGRGQIRRADSGEASR